MASWTVMLSHCWPLVFSQVLKGSSWTVGIKAENWKIILSLCPRHTCNVMSYTIMFKCDESIHFALIVKGTSQCLESLNRVRSTDGSPSEQKINHHEFPVSQKIVLIILSVEGIVLAFFFFEDMMWCHSRLALFWSYNSDTTPCITVTMFRTSSLTAACFNKLWSHSGICLSVIICSEPSVNRYSRNTKGDTIILSHSTISARITFKQTTIFVKYTIILFFYEDTHSLF